LTILSIHAIVEPNIPPQGTCKMPNPVYTNLDAQWLDGFVTRVGQYLTDADNARLLSIASNIQSLDEQAAHAFRDGQLQVEINRAERSNIISVPLSKEVEEALARGTVRIQHLPPKDKRDFRTAVEELSLDDLFSEDN
jgi:hypothetical protein